jgi:hypothetical protein
MALPLGLGPTAHDVAFSSAEWTLLLCGFVVRCYNLVGVANCKRNWKGTEMSEALDAARHAALKLTEGDRLLLASELMDSISENLPGWSFDDPAFLEELHRRGSDGSIAVPWLQVRDELKAGLRR